MRERQLFEEAKKRNDGAAVPEDMEWCFYAELYDPPEPRLSAGNQPTRYDDHTVSTGWDATSGMLAIDSEGSGHADLLVWSRDRLALFKRGTEAAKNAGLESLRDVRSVSAGDFDNDGLADLCVITGSGATLFHNNHGTFTKYAEMPNTAGVTKALWLDYDHDYDLDLLLFGPNPVLMRNNGNGKFEDHTPAFPFVKGNALDAVLFAIHGDTAARDVVVSYADRPGVLYTDRLNGVFEASDLPMIGSGVSSLDAQDFNHDGFLDLVSYRPEIFAVRNDSGKLAAAEKATLAPSVIRADFNGDKREDYARILPDGSLHLYTNSSAGQSWVTVRIQGIKNIKEAVGATVEMKSGAFYDKRIYQGVPLAFAMDGHADADTIRITWPNGLIQNETKQKSGEALAIAEAQRLSGSCPMIFAWNGHAFQFITDVLGRRAARCEFRRRQLFPGRSRRVHSDSGRGAEGPKMVNIKSTSLKSCMRCHILIKCNSSPSIIRQASTFTPTINSSRRLIPNSAYLVHVQRFTRCARQTIAEITWPPELPLRITRTRTALPTTLPV